MYVYVYSLYITVHWYAITTKVLALIQWVRWYTWLKSRAFCVQKSLSTLIKIAISFFRLSFSPIDSWQYFHPIRRLYSCEFILIWFVKFIYIYINGRILLFKFSEMNAIFVKLYICISENDDQIVQMCNVFVMLRCKLC